MCMVENVHCSFIKRLLVRVVHFHIAELKPHKHIMNIMNIMYDLFWFEASSPNIIYSFLNGIVLFGCRIVDNFASAGLLRHQIYKYTNTNKNWLGTTIKSLCVQWSNMQGKYRFSFPFHINDLPNNISVNIFGCYLCFSLFTIYSKCFDYLERINIMNSEIMLSPQWKCTFCYSYYAVDQRIDFDLICINFDQIFVLCFIFSAILRNLSKKKHVSLTFSVFFFIY